VLSTCTPDPAAGYCRELRDRTAAGRPPPASSSARPRGGTPLLAAPSGPTSPADGYDPSVSKYPENDTKFQLVRDLDLPAGKYAITSSGPLGVREIREIGDIDLIVADDLWNELAAVYPATQKDGVTVIRVSPDIEVIGIGLFGEPEEPGQPSVAEQIAQADIIDGLPFVSLRHVLYFKRQMNREKDQRDIAALERLLDQR
jgi:hypothetical protein